MANELVKEIERAIGFVQEYEFLASDSNSAHVLSTLQRARAAITNVGERLERGASFYEKLGDMDTAARMRAMRDTLTFYTPEVEK